MAGLKDPLLRPAATPPTQTELGWGTRGEMGAVIAGEARCYSRGLKPLYFCLGVDAGTEVPAYLRGKGKGKYGDSGALLQNDGGREKRVLRLAVLGRDDRR